MFHMSAILDLWRYKTKQRDLKANTRHYTIMWYVIKRFHMVAPSLLKESQEKQFAPDEL